MDKRSFLLYIAKAISLFGGLCVQILIARIAGLEGYGSWSLFMNLVFIFTVFSDWGTSLNGARMMQLENGSSWVFNAQYWRKKLSLIFTFVYFFVIFLLYNKQVSDLFWGFPMILFYGHLLDWYDRGRLHPHRAAIRQIIQSVLQLTVVVLVFFFKGSLALGIGLYAATAGLTYYFSAKKIQLKISAKTIDGAVWFKRQMPVVIGWVAYHLTYNIPLLLLSFWSGPSIAGSFASHFILYTSLSTFSVITMDIFMAKTDLKSYFRWQLLVTFFSAIGILASKWYYHLLFSGEEFKWNFSLTILMTILCVVHAIRLMIINKNLYDAALNLFYKWSVTGLFIHVFLIGLYVITFSSYSSVEAGLLLLSAEILLLAIISFKRKFSNV